MKSVWTPETLTPSSRSRSPGAGSASTDGIPDPNAMWQVAFSSKSVSQNVEPRPAHGGCPVDEGDLPEIGRLLVDGQLLPDDLGAARGRHVGDATALEPDGEIGDTGAARHERLRGSDEPLGAAPVRRREDLFGRHVGDVRDSGRGLERRAAPASGGIEADREIGVAAGEPNGVERTVVQRVRARLEHRGVLTPRRDRVGLIEPGRLRDGVPESLDVRFSEDLCRPSFVRRGDDRPVHVPVRDVLEHRQPQVLRIGPTDQRRIEVGEQVRRRVPAQRDDCRILLRPPANPVEEVRRRPSDLGLGPSSIAALRRWRSL